MTTDKNQSFRTTLDGTTIRFVVYYNERQNVWYLDIQSIENDNVFVKGLALLTGVDILRQYNLNLGSLLMLNVDESLEDASPDNLGVSLVLEYLTPDEVEALQNG